ncbi:MAG: 3-phosphoshikimate 1-carboxyvinyltransferase, partial [Bacteroidetes bacterium]
MDIFLDKAEPVVAGHVPLPASKSLSNRALIIRALAPEPFPIHHLAEADDTQRLLRLLDSEDEVLDAGPAGTTFRFLTALLAFRPGVQVLTGTERMKQRPVGELVEALRRLGAHIEYLEKEGYPPLRIGEARPTGLRRLEVRADVSSQFITALLLVAPTLPEGLELELQGPPVSRSYIRMTLALMQHFGVPHRW